MTFFDSKPGSKGLPLAVGDDFTVFIRSAVIALTAAAPAWYNRRVA